MGGPSRTKASSSGFAGPLSPRRRREVEEVENGHLPHPSTAGRATTLIGRDIVEMSACVLFCKSVLVGQKKKEGLCQQTCVFCMFCMAALAVRVWQNVWGKEQREGEEQNLQIHTDRKKKSISKYTKKNTIKIDSSDQI